MDKRKRVSQIKSRPAGLIFALSVACLIMIIFGVRYYREVQDTISAESSGYLHEISNRIVSNINRLINDNYAVLDTLETVLEQTGTDTFAGVKPLIDAEKTYWNYQDILMIDGEGVAYSTNGKEIVLSSDSYLKEAVLNKERALSMSQVVEGNEYIIFIVPVEHLELEGKQIVALAGCYDATSFDQVLSMTSFGNQAYSYIIGQDGSVIVRSTAQAAKKSGYNIFSTLSGVKMRNGDTLEKMQSDVAQGKSGQISYTLNKDEGYYTVYMPIEQEEWYLLTFVPLSVVNEKSEMLLKMTLVLLAMIILLFAVLLIYLAYTFYCNKKSLEKIAFEDVITGGNTIQKFYQLAGDALIQGQSKYALVYTNVTKFKVLNEQLGQQTCDEMLRLLNKFFESGLEAPECMGRITADNFCILVKYKGEADLLRRFEEWFRYGENYVAQNKQPWTLPVVEFGIYIIEDEKMPFPLMIDRAKLGLKLSPHTINNKMRYAIYDDKVRLSLVREKHLEDMMEDALKNEEFQVYLQPKYLTEKVKMGGAEALTRWQSPTEGMNFRMNLSHCLKRTVS